MLTLFCFVKWGDQKVFQTNFSYTKAHAHGQAPLNGAFSKSIAPMVRELQVSNKQNNNKKTKWAVLASQYSMCGQFQSKPKVSVVQS